MRRGRGAPTSRQGGRWTGFDQSVAAVTTTVEYRRAFRQAQTIVRVEHRYDHSSGTGGGFFRDGDTDSGAGLTPGQHLFMVSVILSVEGSAGQE